MESPHVVTVYDAGSLDDDRPYLVMSYADQGTLAVSDYRGANVWTFRVEKDGVMAKCPSKYEAKPGSATPSGKY